MSIQKFEPRDIEFFTIQTTPVSDFASGSSGVTGSAYVYPRRSTEIKEFFVNWSAIGGAPTGAYVQISDVGDLLKQAKLAPTPAELQTKMTEYLDIVRDQPQSQRNTQKQEVVRMTPGVNLNLDMTRKFVTTNVLMPYYAAYGTNYDFAYTNYHSLNFLTASGLPTASALLYTATGSSAGLQQLVSSSYLSTGSLSFDFWVNPKYTNELPGREFKAGTIFHLSGAYALSLLSGSSLDSNGYVNGYKLLLQLSSSADLLPSTVNTASMPTLVFTSSVDSLVRNKWQHVTVRWGTESYNFGSGSFIVDGTEKGTFYIPSASVAPRQQSGLMLPSILTVGNFLEVAGTGIGAYFFSDRARIRFGVDELVTAPANQDEPTTYRLNHPLNAEVHELKILSRFATDNDISTWRASSALLGDPDLLFYLPPMFTREALTKSVDTVGGQGGVLVHPFQAVNGTTEHPFNVDMSFDTGGHYINLENFSRDFATGNYPRLIGLTGSAMLGNTEQLTSNQFLYATGSVCKASLTVLPCDNGNFMPSYYPLLKNLNTSSFVTDKGLEAFNLISLRNMYSLDSIYDLVAPVSGSATLNTDLNPASIYAAMAGFDSTSSFGTLNPQRTPTILQRTQENGSLQVVMFDISNLFYGNKIKPGTLTITDSSLSCSFGKVNITLKDDGFGSLYRADSTGSLAAYNSVGNVFYDNGIVLINNPSLYWFGQTGFNCHFEGERNIHVMQANLYANALELVSSSNPTWSDALSASNSITDFDTRYVYITDLLLHDDSLNVIARTKTAQPIMKRTGERLKFCTKMDF